MPRIARPSLTWSSVSTLLATTPGLRNVLAPTSNPSSTRLVAWARAPSATYPSRMGWSGSPKIASRWSQVHTLSKPRCSARFAAARKPGQSEAWLQSTAPRRMVVVMRISRGAPATR